MDIKTIAENFYLWVVTALFGEIPQNEWYTTHLDAIQGITTVILCSLVLLLAIAIITALWRFCTSILTRRF